VGKDWSQLGSRILDVARLATSIHLATVARRSDERRAVAEPPAIKDG
jgi:hypothetical protein